MLTPGEIEALSMTFDKQMRALETQVMTDIIRRIRINGEITRSADWQMHRLQQMGYAKSDIEEAIKKHLNLSDEEVEEMYKKIMEEGYARDTELYNKAGIDRIPFEENYTLQQSISAIALQTSNEMKNISQSLGFAVRNADGSLSFAPAAEYYQSTLDNAINGIAQGVFDYNTAIKRAVSEMTNSGLRTVDYASGWSNRVDVAARRAIMTGLSQLTGKVNDMNAEELGTDTFEVTWHGGARPSHQVWQGKWYTKDELVSVCGLGTVTGLHGANCYHDYYPVIPGISEPSYTAEELEELNRQENIPVKYGDKEYTKYEALQRQRRLETTMRAQRQKIKLLKEGGADEDDIIAARARYRGTSAEYTRFSEAMKLPQQRQRVTVDGLGNIGQGKWKISVGKSNQNHINSIDNKLTKSKKGDKIPSRDGFKLIKGNHSIEDDIGTSVIPVCNPNYQKGGDYSLNCGYCSATYEMRRRGYDVIANPKHGMLVTDWKKLFKDCKPIGLTSNRSDVLATELQNKLSAFGDGARGSLFVDWKGNYRFGHFFSWEVENGVVRFIDGQTGETDVSRYIKMIKPTKTICLRWDDLEPSEMIKDACKNKGGG